MFRKSTYNYLLLAALVVTVLSIGCASTSMRIQVLVPAHINVPQNIEKLALVNRYRPEKGEGFLNILEGAVSGENIGQDRRSAEAALAGLTNALAGSPRFSITRPAIELRGTGRADFPDPLSVQEVNDICQKASANALVTIEAFDSDQSIACSTAVRERKNKQGQTEKYTVWLAKKAIRVTVGWRMYDAGTGNLIDEFRMFETVYFNAEGNSEALAINNLPNGESVTSEIGRVTGNKYSQRISPTWVSVNRDYYSRGCDAFKVAKRKLKFSDWAAAEKFWELGLKDEKVKIQGRAMYNLALAAEMRGELQEASDKARQSMEKYGNKRGRQYFSILQGRIMDQQRLNEQMQGR